MLVNLETFKMLKTSSTILLYSVEGKSFLESLWMELMITFLNDGYLKNLLVAVFNFELKSIN